MTGKTTSKTVAKAASKTLRDGRTSEDSKAAAGSALSQVNSGRTTQPKAAQAASKVLDSPKASAISKKAAGSTLAQTPKKK